MDQTLIRKLVSADEEYLRDESKKIGHAESISFPETHEQVSQIMAQLYETGTPVTVQGSRTGLAAAAVPFGGHVLNMSRMDKVLGMREEDGHFYITVQPGVILQKLNKAIAARSFDTGNWDEASQKAYKSFCKASVQMFTPDPTESTATIGGMVACNASGARSYYYGATRKHIQAVRGVLANGQGISLHRGQIKANGTNLTLPTEQGGTVSVTLPSYKMPNCKNASGYYCCANMDALDLLIGSDGTLVVFTEIELSLLPVPALTWGATAFFAQESQAVSYTKLAKQIKQGIVSIEYFDPCALDILRRQKAENTAFAGLPFLPDTYGCAVYTELHCDTEEQEYELLESLSGFCVKAGGDPDMTWVACSDSDRDMLYFFRHAVPESVNMQVERTKHTYPEVTKVGGDMAVPDEYFEELLELYDTTLKEEGLQLLGRAKTLAEESNRPLYAVVLGKISQDSIKLLYASGANEVICSAGAALEEKLEQPYADSLISLSKQFEPDILLVGATPFGRAFAPRVAAALGTGLTADCTELSIDAESGLLLQTRPAFGGNMMATIRTADSRPQMATVRPGVLPLPEPAEVSYREPVIIDYNGQAGVVKLLKEKTINRGADISQSKIIVSAGRGIGQKKNLKLVQALADKLGGQVGASRPLVDMGFCPYSSQIGQTGYSVAPDLLICCGISGAVQHLAGIGGAKTVIAINTDPKAPIFDVADYKIVGDCVSVLENMIKALD
ncbi:MAG: FAD-binding protein [Clostridia bacterium]|nr:FAD-binding protein [Clostridia bacterium]